MASSSTGIATTIDVIGDDNLQNILARLPATSFASAACVNRSWNLVSDHVLCRPKLSSARMINPSLQVSVEGVLDKVLSEPIRPHFAIAFVDPKFNLQEAHRLITAKLGTRVPVIAHCSRGIIGTDAISEEFTETWYKDGANIGIMLTVGFVPGMKVKIISLLLQNKGTQRFMIDKFITDIWDFSTNISGRQSPAAIMMFSKLDFGINEIMEKMDYAMSSETVIVGDGFCNFQHTNGGLHVVVALVFAMDRDKPPGVGETQFHSVLSSGLIPASPAYKAARVREERDHRTSLAARREGPGENLVAGRILNQAEEEELRDTFGFPNFYIGVTKERKCSIGRENVGWMTSLAFHQIVACQREHLVVNETGIQKHDTFRLYRPNTTHVLSSVTNVSSHMRSFGQRSTTGGDKLEVFGGFIFTSFRRGDSFSCQPNIDRSPFLDNFPGVTLGGTVCIRSIGRGDLTPYVKESQEQKSVRCCVHELGAVYLIMSYTP